MLVFNNGLSPCGDNCLLLGNLGVGALFGVTLVVTSLGEATLVGTSLGETTSVDTSMVGISLVGAP